MGKCCSSQKTKKLTRKSSQDYLKFKSKSYNFSIKLDFHPSKPLSSYLNNVIFNTQELALGKFEVKKAKELFKDYNKSLKDLEVHPNDTFFIENKESSVKISDESIEELAEEESSTGLRQVSKYNNEAPKQNTEFFKDSDLPLRKVKLLSEDSELSSLNQADLTIGDKKFQSLCKAELKGGLSVMIDSDESSLKPEMKLNHPSDFFKDLQGPFSCLI